MAQHKTQRPKSSAPAAKADKSPAKPPEREKGTMPRKGPATPWPGGPQRKVAVGPSDDAYEREANAVADRVVRGEQASAISHLPRTGLPAAAQREVAPIEGDPDTVQTLPLQRADKTGGQETIPDESEVIAQRATVTTDEPDTSQPSVAQPTAQRATAQSAKDGEKRKEEKPVQKKSSDAGTRSGMSAIAARAIDEKDQGDPLDPELRDSLESSLGTDLDDVRVHTGAKSEDAAHGLNARAFTQGRDIWLGRGESSRDTRLMGHEATHVVQQTRRAQQPVVQRARKKGAASQGKKTEATEDDPNILETKAGRIDIKNRTMELPAIRLPELANKKLETDPDKLVAAPPKSRGDTKQRDTWVKDITGHGITTAVEELLPDKAAISLGKEGKKFEQRNKDGIFYLKTTSRDRNSFLVGDRKTIQKLVRLPNWGSRGNHDNVQVDHIHEMQLGGVDKLDNYQLLDSGTNQALGNAIQKEIAAMITAAAKPFTGKGKHWPEAVHPDKLRANYKVTFDGVADEKLPGPKTSRVFWTRKQVSEEGAHLKALQVLTAKQLNQLGVPLVGKSTLLVVYTSSGAGVPKAIKLDEKGEATKGLASKFDVQGFKATALEFKPGEGGKLFGKPTGKKKLASGELVEPIGIQEIAGLQYTGRLETADLQRKLKFDVLGASPVTLNTAELTEKALVASGEINLTPPLFKKGVTLGIDINGEDIAISKTFTAGDFALPGPIKITEAALTLSAGTAGLKADGNLDFEITSVGTGRVRGIGDVSKGFAVEGQFDFDKKLFNDSDATIKVRYAEDKFSGEGTLKIGKGKVRGVKSATLAVKVDGDIWSAEGVVEPDVPGVKQGSMSVRFDPKGGLEITGRLEFGEGVPRLKNGFLQAKVTKKDEAYSVEGEGHAELDIPGGSGGVTAYYKDGLFAAEASLAYEKGFAKGSITAGITNIPVGDDGKPTGEPSPDLIVYGSGSITIRFTPWLQGTAGIQIAPDGKMVITGKVELPSAIDVFPKKAIEKKLLGVGVDIPIFGVSVAGQRIGVFLNIEGKLIASASIGPAQLRDVGVEISYDPEDESSARITGTARFVVPGEAGLKLAISGAIGVGIPIVSAKAGLEVSGTLGIKGEAVAEATLEWTPATGINLDAAVSLMAEPRFTIELTGFALVEADLLFTEIELYSERWSLAKFEYGSGLRVGARLPVKITGGVLRDLSLDDVEFIVPEIDPLGVAKDLIDRVV